MTPDTLSLGAELTIVKAAALRETLLARLATAPRELRLDLGEVSEFDSAGVQLLLAARRSLAEAGGRLVVGAASATVRQGLEVFGLTGLLDAPAAKEPA
ncbi:MAG: STAS domain-containing protein [Rubrivivax sp.]|nr:STAS domain-containing protein [Rubrivivax sp.]